MSSPKMLFLRWDGSLTNAVTELKESQIENEFFDVTVVAGDGGKVQANKLVLAAASTFFFKIFKENPEAHPLMYLGGVSYQMLQYLMDFMYTGEVRIHPDDANDFVDIAVELGFKGMIGIPTSEKTGGDRTKSSSTTSNPRKKRVTFAEISPAPKPPIPPGVISLTPATHQNQVSGGVHSSSHPQSTASIPKTFGLSPKYSHSRVLTSRTRDLSPEQSHPQCANSSTPDLSPPQSSTTSTPALHLGLTSITPVLHHGRHTGDSPGLSSRPHSVHKVTPSPRRQTTAEGVPVIKSSQSHIETPSYYHSNSPEATSEKEQDITMFKVEVGPASDYNDHYDKNENGEQLISRFSERRLHKKGGTKLSKDQELKDQAIPIYAMPKEEIDFNSEAMGMEAPDGRDEQILYWYDHDDSDEDNDPDEDYDEDDDHDEDYDPGKDYDRMIPTREQDDQVAIPRNDNLIKSCYIKLEKIKCSKTLSMIFNKQKKIPIGEKEYKCFICFKTFSSPPDLKRHKRIHTAERQFQCLVCLKRFSHVCHLRAHLNKHKKIHTGDRPYQCPVCAITFSESTKLKTHLKIHSGNSAEAKLDTFARHSSIYLGSRKYECKICKKVANFCNMKSHMEVSHLPSNGHRCDICGKISKTLRTLRDHKKVHTSERPFQCLVCPKTFSQEADLETHKKLHNGGRPYQCSECHKTFSHSAFLNEHNKIHTGERPHKCMDCDKAFLRLNDLKRHMNRKKKCSKKH